MKFALASLILVTTLAAQTFEAVSVRMAAPSKDGRQTVGSRMRRSYALTVGKIGPKLTPAKSGTSVNMKTGENHIQAMGVTLPQFAGLLSGYLRMQVRDETGIPGIFDIVLNTSITDFTGIDNADNSAGTIFSGLEEVGLKLESRTSQAPFLTVTKGDRIPIEN